MNGVGGFIGHEVNQLHDHSLRRQPLRRSSVQPGQDVRLGRHGAAEKDRRGRGQMQVL